MKRLRFLTAGESHGPAVLATIEGMPAGMPLVVDDIHTDLARRQKGSRRRARTKSRLARTHARVANVRTDALHELTTELASTYGTVVVEDLNVAGMTAKPKPKPKPGRNRPGASAHNGRRAKAGLNRAVLDVSPAEFRRQLTYKLAWRRGALVAADRFFPSSKTCSSCGETKTKLSLATRTYRCECGLEIDRDLNAALNLAAYGRRVVAGSGPETLNALVAPPTGGRTENPCETRPGRAVGRPRSPHRHPRELKTSVP